MSRPRKILVVTTTRAEYGILSSVLAALDNDVSTELQLVAAAAHMSALHGGGIETIREEYPKAIPLEILGEDDTAKGMGRAVGIGCQKFSELLPALAPDIVLLTGDRFELMAFALPCLFSLVPIAHLHGGELTFGAIDDAVRHAVTKLACIHFVSTPQYRARVIQLGEDPAFVHLVGAPALDDFEQSSRLTRSELERDLRFNLGGDFGLVTFHPETRSGSESSISGVRHLCAALRAAPVKAIISAPNADAGGMALREEIVSFVASEPDRFLLVESLGRERYFSLMRHAAFMAGNSSSGILEAPSFELPVVNLGDRQAGRVRAGNVIDTPSTTPEILAAITKALSPQFRNSLKGMENPYRPLGSLHVGRRIVEILKSVPLGPHLIRKRFHDRVA